MKRKQLPNPKPNQNRAGYLFVGVLFTTVLVASVGLSALVATQRALVSARDREEQVQAHLLARSAIEWGLQVLKDDTNWRTSYSHSVTAETTGLNGGTMSFLLLDDDGSLSDNTTDTATLRGIGIFGDAIAAYEVDIIPTGPALASLACGLAAYGNIGLTTDADLTSTGIVHAGNSVTNALIPGTISANVEAVNTIFADTYGTTTSGATPRTFPSKDTLGWYREVGTTIRISSLPLDSGDRVIERQLLSSNNNPYGAETNPYGIYVIDCQNQKLVIKDCRIAATLVILNPGAGSETASSVLWEPAIANLPALLVDGDFTFHHGQDALKEGNLLTNFNPSGAEYQGESDNDTNDSYPSLIRGLVAIFGTMTVDDHDIDVTFEGCVLCQTCNMYGQLFILYSDLYTLSPPPGFRDGTEMAIIPGTWRRVAL